MAKAQSARTVGLALRGEQTNTDVWSTSASLTTTAQTFGPYQFYCTNSAVNSNATFSLAFYLAYGTISDVWIDNVVVKDITTGFVTANAVTVSPARLSLTTGQTGQLTKTVAPANATNNTVTWTSSNTSIATVSSTGMVTAVSTGNATITATSADGGFTAQSVVSVNVGVTSYSTRLSGTANERYGLAKSLSVMPGDTIQMEVYAKYLDNNANNWNAALTNLMTSIAQGTAPTGTFVDGGAAGSIGGTTFPFVGTLPRTGDTGTGPKAYLNYIVFDKNFVYKTGGFKRLSAAPIENGSDVPHERLAFDGAERIIITEPGFVYIYLSNENDTPLEVYFDDFKVDHIKGPIVSSQDYYPFGLAFNSYQRENSVQQQYQFSGKEIQDELNLQWMDFGARMYDAHIGRWQVVDPLSEKSRRWSVYNYAFNNPLRFVDPDGMEADDFGNVTFQGYAGLGEGGFVGGTQTSKNEGTAGSESAAAAPNLTNPNSSDKPDLDTAIPAASVGFSAWKNQQRKQTQDDPWHGYRLEITDAEIILFGTMTSTNSTVDAAFHFGEKGKLNLAAYKVSETKDGKKLNYTIVNNTIASPLARVVQSELEKGHFPFYSEYTYIKNVEGEHATGKLADENNYFDLARIIMGAGNYKYLSSGFTPNEYNMPGYRSYLKELEK